MDINNNNINSLCVNTTTWNLDKIMVEMDHHHHQIPISSSSWPNHHYPNYSPPPLHQTSSSSYPVGFLINEAKAILEEELEDHEQGGGEGEEEEEEEELGAMKEMLYKIAAMQPVDIDPATIRKPKRRNVRISDDPQSVAARHRRERISEKIRILQRLVPGGTKMDTASMLDEAIRYVKFLKRQIKLLQTHSQQSQQQQSHSNVPIPIPIPSSTTHNNNSLAIGNNIALPLPNHTLTSPNNIPFPMDWPFAPPNMSSTAALDLPPGLRFGHGNGFV